MKYAFPLDELNPLECSGRGPDHDNPDNININDVLGDYSLTLIDTLDTLALLGNSSGTFETSVPDPNPDPDTYVFGPPGSGSVSQRYGSGSGSFYHQAK
jgi:hypothetical protein